ncbi:MAG: YheT family hydrolase [Pseudanabaenaceae cyanobacterium]
MTYSPPRFLRSGLGMTLWAALVTSQRWRATIAVPEPEYRSIVFRGQGGVPLYGWVGIPPGARGTVIATYGITGSLENQGYLRVLGAKAYAQGIAVVLFDWRAHGVTGLLSPTLTSDGLYEGADFVHIAQQGQRYGCPPPFFFLGYSLGGQLALWGAKEAQGISEIAGAAVISPNLDAARSLRYLCSSFWGRAIEQRITRELQTLAWQLYHTHPGALEKIAIERANSIWGYDQELVVPRLGLSSVEEYYRRSSPLPFLPHLNKPTLIIYPQDDPLFDPTIVPDLIAACRDNAQIKLLVTRYGGHVGLISSPRCQRAYGDQDCWWGWNRILDWCGTFLGNSF